MTERRLKPACVINPAVTHPWLREDSSDDKPVLTARHLGSNQESAADAFKEKNHQRAQTFLLWETRGSMQHFQRVRPRYRWIHPVIWWTNKLIKYKVMTWPDGNDCLLSLKQMFQLKKRRLCDTLNVMRRHKLPSNCRLTFFTELLYRHHRITWPPPSKCHTQTRSNHVKSRSVTSESGREQQRDDKTAGIKRDLTFRADIHDIQHCRLSELLQINK